MKWRIDRRRLARIYDWCLVTMGPPVLMYLTTDATTREWLTQYGPWVLPVLGLLNIILNRLPKELPADDTDRAGA